MLFAKAAGSGKIHQNIYESIRKAILSGHMGPGTRLPSSRALANEAGVSRNSVLAAYDQLMAEGYLSSQRGSGTFVSSELPDVILSTPGNDEGGKRQKVSVPPLSNFGRRVKKASVMSLSPEMSGRGGLRYDFRYGLPAVQEFPHEAWRKIIVRRMRSASLMSMQYAPPEGYAPLREALADHLRRYRAVACSPEQILVVGGSQQALDLTTRLLLNPNDHVLIEDPNYLGARHTFLSAGTRLIPASVGAEGIDISAMGKSAEKARLAYVTPSHQFPTGTVMSLARRLSLLEWAERTDAHILEDDYDSEFRYEGRPIESIQGLDRSGRVIYMGTFSKVMFPALRVGYLVLPEPLVETFKAAKWLADRHTPTLEQEALTDFIVEGHFERHLRRSRERNAARRVALLEALSNQLGDRVEIRGANAGVHLLVRLPGMTVKDLEKLISQAQDAGIGIYSAARYYLKPLRRAELLFGFASLSERDIQAGIRKLTELINSI